MPKGPSANVATGPKEKEQEANAEGEGEETLAASAAMPKKKGKKKPKAKASSGNTLWSGDDQSLAVQSSYWTPVQSYGWDERATTFSELGSSEYTAWVVYGSPCSLSVELSTLHRVLLPLLWSCVNVPHL